MAAVFCKRIIKLKTDAIADGLMSPTRKHLRNCAKYGKKKTTHRTIQATKMIKKEIFNFLSMPALGYLWVIGKLCSQSWSYISGVPPEDNLLQEAVRRSNKSLEEK